LPNFEGKPEHEQLGLFLSRGDFRRKPDEFAAFRIEEKWRLSVRICANVQSGGKLKSLNPEFSAGGFEKLG